MAKRGTKPRPGDPGSHFARWMPPSTPAEQEGPPVPLDVIRSRSIAFWGNDWTADDDANLTWTYQI